MCKGYFLGERAAGPPPQYRVKKCGSALPLSPSVGSPKMSWFTKGSRFTNAAFVGGLFPAVTTTGPTDRKLFLGLKMLHGPGLHQPVPTTWARSLGRLFDDIKRVDSIHSPCHPGRRDLGRRWHDDIVRSTWPDGISKASLESSGFGSRIPVIVQDLPNVLQLVFKAGWPSMMGGDNTSRQASPTKNKVYCSMYYRSRQ